MKKATVLFCFFCLFVTSVYCTGLLLQSAGYPAEKITVEADILEDNSINITKVVLWPKNSADYNAAAQLLARQAGLAPEILQQGEAYGTTGN